MLILNRFGGFGGLFPNTVVTAGGYAETTTNTNSPSFAGVSCNAAAGGRVVYAMVVFGVNGDVTAVSCTLDTGGGAVAMTQIGSTVLPASSEGALAIFQLTAPTGTTATVAPSCTISGAGTMARCSVKLLTVVNQRSLTAVDTADDADNGAGAMTGNLVIPAGGFAIGLAGYPIRASSFTWTGLTEASDDNITGEASTNSTAFTTSSAGSSGLSVTATGALASPAGMICASFR